MGYKINNHRKVSEKLIVLPVLGLATITAGVVFGTNINVNADTCPASTCSDTTTVEVTVSPVISLATPDAIEVSMGIPTSSGVFASGSDLVGVSTNDSAGYAVYITGVSGGNTDLRHSEYATNSAKFSTVASDQSVDTSSSSAKFGTNNTWGWSGDTTTTKSFHALQAYGQKHTASVTTRFVNKTASTVGDTCTMGSTTYSNYECSTLYIGATGDNSIVAGTYTGEILLTAVPNSYADISDYDNTK